MRQILRLVLLCAVGVPLSFGSPLSGQLYFIGTGVISLLGIDFIPPSGGGIGDVIVLPGANTGDFAIFNAGPAIGAITDWDPSMQAGVPLNVANWLTVPGFSFTLEFIRPGFFSSADCFSPPATQQTCTMAPFDPDGPGPLPPILSPYNLTNFTDAIGNLGSTIAFSLTGRAINAGTGDLGTFEGAFNGSLLNVPYQNFIDTIFSGGTVTLPFEATLTVSPVEAIPEPSTFILLGSALLGLGLIHRRS